MQLLKKNIVIAAAQGGVGVKFSKMGGRSVSRLGVYQILSSTPNFFFSGIIVGVLQSHGSSALVLSQRHHMDRKPAKKACLIKNKSDVRQNIDNECTNGD